MARRFLDEEQNIIRKRNNAASSIARNITATAKQVKTQQRPVQRRAMNISKATVTPKTQAKAQKSTQITQPKKQRNYNQNTWSPVVDDPVKEYFSPVPDRPKVVDPAQQRRRNITLNAINEVEQTPAQYRTPNNQNINLPNVGEFLKQSGQNIEAGATLNLSDQAFGWGDFALRNQQEYNAEREAWMKAVNEDESIRNNVLTQQLMNTSNQLADNPMANTTWGQLMQNFGYNMGPGGLAGAAGTVIDNVNALKAFNLVPMAVASYGSGLREKLNEGYEDKYARRYGLANAFNETLFQESIDPSGTVLGATPMTVQSLAGEAVQEGAGQLVDPLMDLTLRDYEDWGDFWNALQGAGRQMISPENLAASAEAAKMGALGAMVNIGMTNPAGAYQQAREDVSNIANRNRDVYAETVNDLKAQLSVLDGANTAEADTERSVIRDRIEATRDFFIQPEALRSSDVVVRNAAQSANRDRIMEQAAQYGVESSLAENMVKISNKIGVPITFDDNLDAKINGKFEDGKIVISTKASDPIATVFSHEVTHTLERSDAYTAYRTFLYKLADSGILGSTYGTVQELHDLIRQPQNYGNVDQATVDNETTAILTQDLLGNAYAIDNLINKNRGLAVRLYEGIKDTLSKFGATAEERMAIDNRRSLQKAEDLFRRAMENPGPVYDPATNTLQFSVKMTKDMLKDYAPNALDKEGNVRPVKDQLRDLYNRENRFGYAAIPVGDKLHFMGIDTEYLLMSYDGLNHALRHTSLPELQEIFTNFGDRVLLGNDFDGKKTAWISFPSVRYGKNMPFAIGLSQDTPDSVRVTLDPGLDYDALDVAMDAYDKHSFSRTIQRILNDPATKKYYGPHWQDLILEFFDPNEAAKSMRQLRSESQRYERRYDKPRDPVRGSQFSVKLTDEDGHVDADYLVEAIERYTENSDRFNSAEEISRIYEDAGNIADMLGVDRATFNQAVEDAVRTAKEDAQDPKMPWKNYDSLGTRVMKALGYEGIDVRGMQGFDNSAYGSVIYDLKPETVQYSRKLTKPAPGQMQLDLDNNSEQALYEQMSADLDNADRDGVAEDLAVMLDKDYGETSTSLVQDDALETLKQKEIMDAVERLFYSGDRANQTQELADIYTNKQIKDTYDENLRLNDEIDSPANIARIWNEYQQSQQESAEKKPRKSRPQRRHKPNMAKARANTPAGMSINDTMINIARGQGSGLLEDVSADTQNIVSRQVERGAKDVTYEVTHNDDLRTSTEQRAAEAGTLDAFYERVMSQRITDPETPFQKFAATASKLWYGNSLNGEVYTHITDLQYLQQKLEEAKEAVIKDARSQGIEIHEIVAKDGTYRARARADGKVDTSELAKDYMTRVDALNEKLSNARKEYAGVGHVAGTMLHLYRSNFENMSPRDQLAEFQKAVNAVNEEMMAKFPKRFDDGTYKKLQISQEFRDAYIAAEDQDARNQMAREFMKEAAHQFPHTKGEMLRSYRYLMMLTNPTTWVRNALGNYGMQGMVSAKNVNGYLLEKGFKAFGFVSDYADFTQPGNQQALEDAYNSVEKTIVDAVAAKNSLHDKAARRKAFQEMGFDGRLLKDLTNYKGETYDSSVHADTLNDTAKQLATTLINSNTDIVSLPSNEVLRQVNEAYNQSHRQFMDSSELRYTNAEGKRAKGDSTIYKDLFADRWSEVAQKNSKTDNAVSRGGALGIFDEERARTPFNENNVLEKLGNRLNNLTGHMMNDAELFGILKMGDQPFTRDRFASTMARIMDAQGYSMSKNEAGEYIVKKGDTEYSEEQSREILDQYGEEAMAEALESVYRDFNWVADLINKARKDHPTATVILDAILPFTRTPFNIGRRAIEYSPLGLARAIVQTKAVMDGKMSATSYINNLSKGMTGSAATVLGILLAHLGLVGGTRPDEDDKEKKFRMALGDNEYALITPAGTYTVDWAAPTASAVLMGAQMYDIAKTVPHKEGENPLAHALQVMAEEGKSGWDLIQPILDTTYMQGLMDSINAFTDNTTNPAISVAESYIGQLTPTLGGKIRKTIDDTARSTYSNNWIDRIVRGARNKSMLVDAGVQLIEQAATGEHHGLEPQLNIHGEEVKNVGGNFAGRLAYNMLSPGTWKPNIEDDYDTELLRLYNSDEVTKGKSSLLPEQLYFLKMGNVPYKFTARERTDLNKYYLQGLRGGIQEYMDSGLYGQQSDQERANMIGDLQAYYSEKTKERYFSSVAPEKAGEILSTNSRTIDTLNKKTGMTPYQVLNIRAITSDVDENGDTIKNTRAMNVRNSLEALGKYDDVLKLINNGDIKPSDVGLNKTVIGWDDGEFAENYGLKDEGLYGAEPDDENTKGTTSTSGKGRKASSGRRSSGGGSSRKSSDLDKLYQKLYDMAMNETLGGIGDIAASMGKSAKTTVKDLVEGSDDTNHAALIRELEKMIAAQK